MFQPPSEAAESLRICSEELRVRDIALLQESRSCAMDILLQNTSARMYDVKHKLTNQRTRISEYLGLLERGEEAFESVSRRATSLMSEILSRYQQAAGELIRRYQDRLMEMECTFSEESARKDAVLKNKEEFMRILSKLVEEEWTNTEENSRTEHKQQLDCLRDAGSAKELRMKTHLLERMSVIHDQEDQLKSGFKDATETSSGAQKSLSIQDRKGCSRLHADELALSRIRLDVSHLRSKLDKLERAGNANLKCEKERLLTCVKKYKDRIQSENVYHEQRLGRLATLFESAKRKVESEIEVTHRIERVWNQCTRLGARSSNPSAPDAIRSLEDRIAEVVIQNSQLERDMILVAGSKESMHE